MLHILPFPSSHSITFVLISITPCFYPHQILPIPITHQYPHNQWILLSIPSVVRSSVHSFQRPIPPASIPSSVHTFQGIFLPSSISSSVHSIQCPFLPASIFSNIYSFQCSFSVQSFQRPSILASTHHSVHLFSIIPSTFVPVPLRKPL